MKCSEMWEQVLFLHFWLLEAVPVKLIDHENQSEVQKSKEIKEGSWSACLAGQWRSVLKSWNQRRFSSATKVLVSTERGHLLSTWRPFMCQLLEPALRIWDIVAHESPPGAARETTPQDREHFFWDTLLESFWDLYAIRKWNHQWIPQHDPDIPSTAVKNPCLNEPCISTEVLWWYFFSTGPNLTNFSIEIVTNWKHALGDGRFWVVTRCSDDLVAAHYRLVHALCDTFPYGS